VVECCVVPTNFGKDLINNMLVMKIFLMDPGNEIEICLLG
jgi:hypothetical protein